jgi:hypothetical protein
LEITFERETVIGENRERLWEIIKAHYKNLLRELELKESNFGYWWCFDFSSHLCKEPCSRPTSSTGAATTIRGTGMISWALCTSLSHTRLMLNLFCEVFNLSENIARLKKNSD